MAGMHRSRLATVVAILVTAAGSAALETGADAQISGSIGGDVVDHHALPGLGSGFGATSPLTPVTIPAVDAR
jgi:hypothetical protein